MYDPTQAPITQLGETTYRHQHQRFGLLPEDRLRHIVILGKTGSGKSNLLASVLAQDLAAGVGVVLLDPHGDLVEDVLPLVPRARRDSVRLLDARDREHPISFNIFREAGGGATPAMVAAHLVTVFRRHWADAWGPRLEHVLRQGVMAVAEDPRATLLFLYQFLTNDVLRKKVVGRLRDPLVRFFWATEFPRYARHEAEVLSPILNKLGAFLADPGIRHIVAPERSRLQIGKLVREPGILLARLAASDLGEQGSHLLGGLLVTAVQLHAWSRPRSGVPIYLVIDEFQHFVTDSLATLLSESRKFGVGLVLAHQYLGQLTPTLRDAVLGNVGSLIVFRVGAEDAAALAPELAPFTADDLQNLPRYEAVMKLLVRGQATRAFSARTLPPSPVPADAARARAAIVTASREQFTTSRDRVERLVADRLR